LYVINILNENDLIETRKLIDKLKFADGKSSAMGDPQNIKNNVEADPNSEHYLTVINFINEKFRKNLLIKKLFLPQSFSQPIINKYSKNGHYGRHFDVSHMSAIQGNVRLDFSFTLMLSSLDDYEGGELVVEAEFSTKQFRVAPGDAVIYQSNNIHQVLEVTRGERIAYIGWLTSNFRDYASLEAMHAFNKMHSDLLKYDLSDEEKLNIAFVENKLRYVLSK